MRFGSSGEMFLKPFSVLLLFFVLGSCHGRDYEWLSKIGVDARQLRLLRQTLKDFRLGNFVEVLGAQDGSSSSGGLLSPGSLGSWPGIDFDDVACMRDLYDVLNGTQHLENWALQMIDSGTKLQSGILQGNIVDLGQFDECVAVERPKYIGQHCLVAINIQMANRNQTDSYNNLVALTVSQCLPSTCTNSDVALITNFLISPFNNLLEPYGARLLATVAKTDCHTSKRSSMTTADWIVTCICIFIVVIGMISTLVDVKFIKDKKKPTTAEQVVRSFSVYTNGKKLFNTTSRGDEMACINGIKFLSMIWVTLGHKYAFYLTAPLVNILAVMSWYEKWINMLILNATVSVDTFFMMAGLLNAYGFFYMVDKKKQYGLIDIIISYIHRYIRLSPPYFIMIAITATVLYQVGDGPVWDRVIGPNVQSCQTVWWKDALYVNNYLSDASCMPQGWYLGADMQMFWAAPIVLYPMWRWPVFGMIEFIVVTMVSIAIPFAISYIYGFTANALGPFGNNGGNFTALMYFPFHTRFQTYMVGLFTGYVLFKIRSKKWSLKLSPIVWFGGWMLAGALMLYSVFGAYWYLQKDNPNSQLSDSFFTAFFRFIWAVGVAWVIFACVTGHGGIVNDMLSWKVFWPLGRLSYCTYLTHLSFMFIKMGMSRIARHINHYDLVEEFFGDLIIGLGSALVLSLLVESPTLVLEKMILGNLRSPKKKPKERPVTEESPAETNEQKTE